ncbi:MAG: PaaI family thioesterase [Lachnospiraceae bacterium]|nr:PaaI family thioesterase [Lachnospiraceae bacterium]
MSEKKNIMYEAKTPEELASMMQERVKGTFSDFLEMKVLEYREGYCRSKFAIKPEHMNPVGSIHGGFLFTIADTTGGIASVILGSDSALTTINGNMQFLNAAINCDTLLAEATVLKSGKRIVYTDVVIKGENGTVYAKGSYTYARIVLPKKKPVAE